MSCPLCKSENITKIDSLSFYQIQDLYMRNLGVRIQESISSDTEIIFQNCCECGLFYFDPLITGDEKFYNSLQQFEWYYPSEKKEFKIAAELIPNGGKVLEVGAGMGMFAKMISHADYTGLEFSRNAISLASKNNIRILEESVEKHANNNVGQYDVVCAFQVLEHVSNIKEFIDAMVRCLKPGGLLILSVPSYDSFANYIPNFELDMPPHHVSKWTDSTFSYFDRVFPVRLLKLWHEPLQNTHKNIYKITLMFKLINYSLLHRRHRLIDFSFMTKVIYKISSVLSVFVPISGERTRGIAVTAVYEKES